MGDMKDKKIGLQLCRSPLTPFALYASVNHLVCPPKQGEILSVTIRTVCRVIRQAMERLMCLCSCLHHCHYARLADPTPF